MAEFVPYNYLKDPTHLHNNLELFAYTFNENYSKILEMCKRVLENSIKKQEFREKKAYEMLEVDEGNWEELSSKIFATTGENGDDNETENKLKFFMDKISIFLNSQIYEGIIKNKNNSNIEDIKSIVKKYIDFFNKPVDEFWNWYKNSELFKDGVIKYEELSFMKQILKNYKLSKNEYKIDEQWDTNLILNDLEACLDVMRVSKGQISNFFGAVKEAALVQFTDGAQNEITTECTSYFENNKDDYKQLNKEYYSIVSDKINKYLQDNNFTMATTDGRFSFEDSLDKNLKADDIFKLNFKIKLTDGTVNIPLLYGASSKAGWGKTDTNPKLMDTSFNNVFINMFKMSNSIEDTVKIVNFIEYATFNSLGPIHNLFERYDGRTGSKYYQLTQILYKKMITSYGYQWLTGGTSPYTHSDFFSVYKNSTKKYYFIPMSMVLKLGIKLMPRNDEEDFGKQKQLYPIVGLFPPDEDIISNKGKKDESVKTKSRRYKLDLNKERVREENFQIINGIISNLPGTISLSWAQVKKGIL